MESYLLTGEKHKFLSYVTVDNSYSADYVYEYSDIMEMVDA